MYECLAGKGPFAGANSVEILAAVLHVEPREPSHWNAAVTPQVDRIVQKMLAKSTAARYRSADELLVDLRAAIAGVDPNAETVLLPSRFPAHRAD